MRAKQAVSNIQQEFVDLDSANADAYATNADQYRSRLEDLDSTIQSALNNRSKNVVFVAGHNAFGYLGERYGFEAETLTGLSPDDQPTPKDIERAQEIINEHGLEYVLADPLESQRAAQQLVAETSAREVLPLTPIPGQTQEWANKGMGLRRDYGADQSSHAETGARRMMSVIGVDDVTFAYADAPVLEDVSIDVEPGAFLGLVGPNGSGKSTLLELMLGLRRPDAGSVTLFGEPAHAFEDGERIAYVSQHVAKAI